MIAISTMVYTSLKPSEALLRLSVLNMPLELSFDNFQHYRKSLGVDYTTLMNEVRHTYTTLSSKLTVGHLPYGELLNRAVDIEQQEKVVDDLGKWISFYAELGIKVAAVHVPYVLPGLNDSSTTYPLKLKESCRKFFKFLVKVGREYNVVLAVENRFERGIYGYLPNDLLELINDVGDEYLRLCLDVGHAHVNGIPPKEYYRALHPHITLIHLHDNDGSKDQHLPPYLGSIDWRGFINTLRELSFKGNYVLEVLCNDHIQRCDNVAYLLRVLATYLLNELP